MGAREREREVVVVHGGARRQPNGAVTRSECRRRCRKAQKRRPNKERVILSHSVVVASFRLRYLSTVTFSLPPPKTCQPNQSERLVTLVKQHSLWLEVVRHTTRRWGHCSADSAGASAATGRRRAYGRAPNPLRKPSQNPTDPICTISVPCLTRAAPAAIVERL